MRDYWRRQFSMQPTTQQRSQLQGEEPQRAPKHHHHHHRHHVQHTQHAQHAQHHRDTFHPAPNRPVLTGPQLPVLPQLPQQPSTPSVPATPTQPQQPAVSADAQAALDRATSVLSGGGGDIGATRPTGGTIIANAPDVNSADDTNPSSARYQSAVSALSQNASAASTALSQLSPDQQAQYQALNAGLSGDPVAQLAAQSLLLSGRLSQTDNNNSTLLSTLSGVASGSSQLASGVDRNQFLAQLTKECATPGAINQGNTDDCVPTQASILLDRLDGAEYARVATEAASPTGTVTWADGSQSTRPATLPSGTGQSIPQQMLSATALAAAGGDAATGASSAGVAAMMSKMFNGNFQSANIDLSSPQAAAQSQANMISAINDSLSSGAPVSASIALSDAAGNPAGAHEVLVNSIQSDGKGGYNVQYTNPWGDEETQSLASFEGRLTSIAYLAPPPAVSASQLMMQQGQYLSV